MIFLGLFQQTNLLLLISLIFLGLFFVVCIERRLFIAVPTSLHLHVGYIVVKMFVLFVISNMKMQGLK